MASARLHFSPCPPASAVCEECDVLDSLVDGVWSRPHPILQKERSRAGPDSPLRPEWWRQQSSQQTRHRWGHCRTSKTSSLEPRSHRYGDEILHLESLCVAK